MKLTLTILVVVALAHSAFAQPTKPETLYNEGQAAYDAGDYASAIAKWRASYELSRESGLLYNIAQAYRRNGDCWQALSTYHRFITVDPTAEQRPLADDFIREMEPQCGSARAPVADPVFVPDPNSGRTLRTAGLVAGGVGVASLAIGIGLGVHASRIGDEVTSTCSVSCDWSTEKNKDASGRRYATVGYALDAIGAVGLIGGAILYYVGDRESDVRVTPLRSQPGESGAVISWGTSW